MIQWKTLMVTFVIMVSFISIDVFYPEAVIFTFLMDLFCAIGIYSLITVIIMERESTQ